MPDTFQPRHDSSISRLRFDGGVRQVAGACKGTPAVAEREGFEMLIISALPEKSFRHVEFGFAAASARLLTIDKEATEIAHDQERLRENIKALTSTAEANN